MPRFSLLGTQAKWPSMLCRAGKWPVMTAVRLGEHTPLATVKRWKSVPSFARRSRFGVFT
jgi:hypothetical protein